MLSSGNIYLVLAILSLAAGLLARGMPVVDGLGKAMFGVFLILYFIVLFFGRERGAGEGHGDVKGGAGRTGTH